MGKVHGRVWTYYGPLSAHDVEREAGEGSYHAEPSRPAAEHVAPELAACFWRDLHDETDADREGEWLARVRYESGG